MTTITKNQNQKYTFRSRIKREKATNRKNYKENFWLKSSQVWHDDDHSCFFLVILISSVSNKTTKKTKFSSFDQKKKHKIGNKINSMTKNYKWTMIKTRKETEHHNRKRWQQQDGWKKTTTITLNVFFSMNGKWNPSNNNKKNRKADHLLAHTFFS